METFSPYSHHSSEYSNPITKKLTRLTIKHQKHQLNSDILKL